MKTACVRTFTSKDGMVLIAATAVGLAGVRAVWPIVENDFLVRDLGWKPTAVLHDAPRVLRVLLPCVVAWTLAILGLRLLRPRPSLRRISCQPGAVACGAVAITLGLKLLGHLAAYAFVLLRGESWRDISSDSSVGRALSELSDQALSHIVASSAPVSATCAIATGWAILAIGRRWRAEDSWIDRAGCMLGALWILLCVCYWWCDTGRYLGRLGGMAGFGSRF